jgi:hypothetical protein
LIPVPHVSLRFCGLIFVLANYTRANKKSIRAVAEHMTSPMYLLMWIGSSMLMLFSTLNEEDLFCVYFKSIVVL